MRRTLPRLAAVLGGLALTMALTAAPVSAEENSAATVSLAQVSFAAVDPGLPGPLATGVLFPAAATVASAEQMRPIVPIRSAPPADFSGIRRPGLLPALYATNVALQALDAHSTWTALGHGAREANPLMQGVAGNRTALLAVKAGAAAGTIYFAEKMWRRNRAGAIAMMVVVNGVTAAIVAHNYKVARDMR